MNSVIIRGKRYKRIPCGKDDFLWYNTDGKPCKDCGVNVGEYHQPYCEAEMCPATKDCDICMNTNRCGGQLCACYVCLTFTDM